MFHRPKVVSIVGTLREKITASQGQDQDHRMKVKRVLQFPLREKVPTFEVLIFSQCCDINFKLRTVTSRSCALQYYRLETR